MRRLVFALTIGSTCMLGAGSARASATFPDVVAQTLQLKAPPECVLCHSNPLGGLGTADTPVGTYLRSRGVRGGDIASLQNGLNAMIAEHDDADGDGVSDVDELKAGTDPNGIGNSDVPPIAYGCGAHLAPRYRFEHATTLAALGFFAAAAMFCRRRPSGK